MRPDRRTLTQDEIDPEVVLAGTTGQALQRGDLDRPVRLSRDVRRYPALEIAVI
jgi:hypothetical protein